MSEAPEPEATDTSDAPEQELLHGAPVLDSGRQRVVHPDRGSYLELMATLHGEGYLMCIDLCAVDYLTYMDRPLPADVTPERFEIVINLLDLDRRERLRVRVQVPQDDPEVASLTSIYPGTEAMEREAYDMFGIAFTDHPDLTRILLPEDWDGHPLRKDYSMGRIPVQFKAPEGRS